MQNLEPRLRPGVPAEFNPVKTREVVSVLKAAIRHADEMREWEAGWKAIDLMIEWQRKHVAWWDANVAVRHAAGGHDQKNADLRSSLSAVKAADETGISQQQVSTWRNGLKRPLYREKLFKPSYAKAMADAERRAELQTGEMEWFTPAEYLEAARKVMGGIDLDPASCAAAQDTVQAIRFYTTEDDGLCQKWAGRVWLNPPYAGKLVAAFAAKMISSLQDIASAIMLTNSYTETSWFHSLANKSDVLCFTRGRIKFESPHGEKCAPTNGQVFFYFGPDSGRFQEEFTRFGLILVRP